ncbi:MAG: DUF1616 domain-containing protein [Thermoplasmata archaeon]
MVSTAPPGSAPAPSFYRYGHLLGLSLLAIFYLVILLAHVGGALQFLLGLAMLFFVPGYATGALLFRHASGLNAAGDFALMVGLSVLFNGIVGIALLVAHVGLNPADIASATIAVCALALLRRGSRRESGGPSRLGPYLRREFGLPGLTASQRSMAYVLLLGIMVSLAGVFYVASLHPAQAPTATLLIGPETAFGGPVPASANVSQVVSVPVTIVNGPVGDNLTLSVISALSQQSSANATSMIGWDLPLHLAPGIGSLDIVSLGSSQSTSLNVSFEFQSAGIYTVQFALWPPSGGPLGTAELPITVH